MRHGEDRLARLRLDPLPARAAELVERRRRAVGADVLLHQVDAVDRQVEPVAAGVLEVEVVALGAGHLQVPQAAVDADAVIDVHDVVVRLELAEALEQLRDRDAARAPRAGALAEDVGLGDDDQPLVGQPEALAELADEHARARRARGASALGDGSPRRRRPSTSWFSSRRARRSPCASRADDDDDALALAAPARAPARRPARSDTSLALVQRARSCRSPGEERVHRQVPLRPRRGQQRRAARARSSDGRASAARHSRGER